MMRVTRRSTARTQQVEKEDGKQDGAVNQFTRAMNNVAKILSPTKAAKHSMNGDCGLRIAISGEKGDAMNKTMEVSACLQRKFK